MKVDKRRKREHKTDYRKRIKFLKAGTPRIVFRKSNRYVNAQYVLSKEAQDKVEFGISSKDLIKHGWPKEFLGGLKSIPASYLLGFSVGKKIIKENLENPIPDFGMQRVLHKTKIYAFLNGLADAGVKIKCDKSFFPEESRIKGESMKNKISVEKIKENLEKV